MERERGESDQLQSYDLLSNINALTVAGEVGRATSLLLLLLEVR